MKFPCGRCVPNGFLRCLPRKTTKNELKFQATLEILLGDETWIYCFTVSSKEVNKVWLSQAQRKTVKKRMFRIFFSADGIIASTVVKNGQMITGHYYGNIICLKSLKKSVVGALCVEVM